MLTLVEFSEANWKRQPDFGNGGGGHSALELAACIAEESGEVAAAVLGVIGAKKRKAHITPEKAARECADVITYCDLLIQKLGFKTEDILRATFNAVSERCGSATKLTDWNEFWDAPLEYSAKRDG